MKLSKEELLKKVNAYEIGDEVKIELIEDITDSFEAGEDSELKTKYDELVTKHEELKEKYKARFFEPVAEEKKEESIEEDSEEKEIIDVKEI